MWFVRYCLIGLIQNQVKLINTSTEHILQCNQSEPVADASGRIVDLMNENGSTMQYSGDTVRDQQTRDIGPMLDRCWTSVVDGGPTMAQHWFDFSCSLTEHYICKYILILTYATVNIFYPSLSSLILHNGGLLE